MLLEEVEKIKRIDINNLTPMESLETLSKIQKKLNDLI